MRADNIQQSHSIFFSINKYKYSRKKNTTTNTIHQKISSVFENDEFEYEYNVHANTLYYQSTSTKQTNFLAIERVKTGDFPLSLFLSRCRRRALYLSPDSPPPPPFQKLSNRSSSARLNAGNLSNANIISCGWPSDASMPKASLSIICTVSQ